MKYVIQRLIWFLVILYPYVWGEESAKAERAAQLKLYYRKK